MRTATTHPDSCCSNAFLSYPIIIIRRINIIIININIISIITRIIIRRHCPSPALAHVAISLKPCFVASVHVWERVIYSGHVARLLRASFRLWRQWRGSDVPWARATPSPLLA